MTKIFEKYLNEKTEMGIECEVELNLFTGLEINLSRGNYISINLTKQDLQSLINGNKVKSTVDIKH